MYATPHMAAGFSIILAFKDNLAIGIPLAIASHFILDFVDERGVPRKQAVYTDLLPALLCFIVSLFTGHFWLLFLGNICGNLFDLIDKKLYLAMFIPSKFKATKYFHFQKQIIFPSAKFTKAIGWISALAICSLLLFLK
jgi:hypothetical protein